MSEAAAQQCPKIFRKHLEKNLWWNRILVNILVGLKKTDEIIGNIQHTQHAAN